MRNVNEKAQRYWRDLNLSKQTGVVIISPLTASIAINYWCNSKCDYCKIWKQPMRNVDLEDLKFTARKLKDIGVLSINLSGGEPFLHPHLDVYISYLNELKIFSSVMTNGLLLRPEKLLPVLDSGPNTICLSLDSIDPLTYQNLRGVRLEPILKGLDYLLSLREVYSNFKVSVNCVISRANIDQLQNLVEYCSERNVNIGFQPLHSKFEDWQVESDKLNFKPEDKVMLVSTIESLIAMRNEGKLISCQPEYLKGFPDFLISHTLPGKFNCSAGFTTVAIDYNLNLTSCWLMSSLGNLKEESLFDLWNSEKYALRRQEMSELNCPGCWLRCHTEHCSQEWINTFFNYTSK